MSWPTIRQIVAATNLITIGGGLVLASVLCESEGCRDVARSLATTSMLDGPEIPTLHVVPIAGSTAVATGDTIMGGMAGGYPLPLA
ncbi:MAG: hypothetical protein M5U14_09680 [Acidimicrobiia bacterium]|nr:hypothetical protein [Acidimicrobiia bacterium]